MDNLSTAAIVISLAVVSVVGCWLWANFEDSIEELELRAAKSIAGTKDAYLLACNTAARHEYLYAEYQVFTIKNNITYEDYLLLVITYGTLALN
jgi:hypothetical protein